MTIRRGEPWGTPVERPADLLVVDSDAALAQAMVDEPDRPVGLSGGDVWRSLGSPAPRHEMQRLPIDAIVVTVDDTEMIAVAHVVVRGSWWFGRIIGAVNVDHLGEWNVAPRAHPNDGRLDVVEVDAAMSVRDRWQARSRLVAGTHLPHPCISTRTATSAEWSFANAQPIWVDGVRLGVARSISVTVRPDAFAVVV